MSKKTCFGDLEAVFPVGESGLREVPPECFRCDDRTTCLRAALATREGIEMRHDMVDRAAERGMVGRLKRWSYKKTLARELEERKKK